MTPDIDIFVPRGTTTTHPPLIERIEKSEEGCWLWTGPTDRYGYAKMKVGPKSGRRYVNIHRLFYEQLVGPIPDDLQIDHLCHNAAVELGSCAGGSTCEHRRCVNPEHLEPVTNAENVLRGAASGKTHCKSGHEFTEENTGHYKRRRFCRTCNRVHVRNWYKAKREKDGKPYSRSLPPADRTHCPQGHEYTPENTIRKNKGGGKFTRQCRACRNAQERARRKRKRKREGSQ